MPEQMQSYSPPKITRASFDSLCLYEVTENELDILEQGSPNGTFLNFAIFLFSSALTLLVTLMTVKIESTAIFIIFVVSTVFGTIGSIFLFILWLKSKNSFTQVIKK